MDPNSHAGSDSPPLRSTILGSFLRGRPRNSSQSHINTDPPRELSPSPPGQPPPSPGGAAAAGTNHRRRTAHPPSSGGPVQLSTSNPPSLGLSHMLRRRRSGGAINNSTATPAGGNGSSNRPQTASSALGSGQQGQQAQTQGQQNNIPPPPAAPGTHRIRLVPHLESRRSLKFDAITRDLKPGDPALRIGRFTDRSGLGLTAINALGSNKLAFKSKVVSRAHAEIWAESGGRFFIKDTKSSSGTFLNHMRLSQANSESRPHQIKDGDILQLGVDYQGGTEDIYKSVKIRIELGREWQSSANAFNTNAIKNLKSLSAAVTGKGSKSGLPDCCICLFGVTIRQALFIAPCSHTFHFKCIRPLIESHHPAFSCPLCRTFADLEEDVEVEAELDEEFEELPEVDEEGAVADRDSGVGSSAENPGGIVPAVSTGPGGDDDDSAVEELAAADMLHGRSHGAPGGAGPSQAVLRERQRERERERERDREAGAETEVEADGGVGMGFASGSRRINNRRPVSGQMPTPDRMDLMDEADEADADGEGDGDIEGEGESEPYDEEMMDVESHNGGQRRRVMGMGEDVILVDVDMPHSHSVAHNHMHGVVSSGSSGGSAEGTEEVGNKRKRLTVTAQA